MRLNDFKFVGLIMLYGFLKVEYDLDLSFWQFGFVALGLWLISFERVEGK